MREFISADDADLAAFSPSRASHCKLEALFASLRDVESVTKRIQANDPTQIDALTSAEEAVFVSFLGVRATMPDPASVCAEGFAECTLKRRKISSETSSYMLRDAISTTSNIVERLFCAARTVLSHERHGISPLMLEMILFLKINNMRWDLATAESCL
ncbi:hypothetical protein PR003_g10477 [Phytophthora rubi]|uniref:HAT C-terminal dimerisation domain-containing protein n=1 Tax=Phytophthora rubi TaxID=129364 RepID=A0A6A4FF67_9STRA|nr:hypothetical protein PR001_g25942 [Phytophthora rubi]KAE9340459.1 hypothetical protein PR003_g10477 [Phytophthora rubi]